MTPTLATHLHAARLDLARGLPVVTQAPARDGQAQPWRRGLCLGRDRVADAWAIGITGPPVLVRRVGGSWVGLYRAALQWHTGEDYGYVLPDVETLAGRRHVLDIAHGRGMDLPLDSWAPGVPTDLAEVAAWLAATA